MLVLCIVNIFLSVTLGNTETLTKHTISSASTLGAKCNDGSPGIYYLHHNTNSSKWIIFLEGGGGCSTILECKQRFKKTPYFMSSLNYPDKIQSRSLMSAKIYVDYSKIIIPYCTSDSWLGNSSNKATKNNTSDGHSKLDGFLFRGAVVFLAVINEAVTMGLNESTYVTIAGTSAGGIGAINHVGLLRKKLSNSKISVLLDSSWFINFDDYFNAKFSKSFMNYTGIAGHATCLDVSWGYPCCFSISCLMTKSYIPKEIEILVLFSKFDVYILFEKLISRDGAMDHGDILKARDFLNRVSSYGGHMLHSLEIVPSQLNFHYIVLSCFQHEYITSSSLWETVYQTKLELLFHSVRFEHMVSDKNIKSVTVNGKTIEKIIYEWHGILHNKDSQSGENITNVHVVDGCLNAQCNPTCPQVIYFNTYKSGWNKWKRITLIFIILFIITGCLVIKIVWMLQHHQLKTTQSQYLYSSYDDDELDGIKCLPTCPPHSSVGISCNMLDYDIVNQTQTETIGTLKRNKPAVQNYPVPRQRRLSITNIRKKNFYAPGKKIISGITAYFNPGQLVAIMGPSGSGKTTLLDLLTARKHNKEAEDNILINGLPAEETRDWFIKNSGYVLQLATPYHEELTVRQNLTYTAMMRLPMKMKIQDKMWRVEQVLGQCGLFDVADVVVGGNSNPSGGGLSGGQKRRLCIALQLLDLPSVIFLDEPTSGLDSASSLELLETLHGLTLSGRLVVVTIHQPRLEIFHMFDAILILCHGEVAYFGSPIVAPLMIAEALQGSGQVFDASNPADTIMDVLTNEDSQNIIVNHYKISGEIEAIQRAIARARRHPQKTLSMKFQKQTSSIQNRLLALDGRSSASQTFSQKLYFPMVFLLYSLSLGTCYWKTEKGVLLMSCYMVFSCASQLFMASVIHAHLGKAFALFSLEKADGVGHSHELVLHVFVRVFTQSSIPLIFACGIIYLCALREYVFWKFCLTTLIHLQLNQTWIAIVILTACITPRYSSLVSPLLSAIAGFAGGFLVPEPQMPIFYYWLFYINPTHWAYSAIVKTLISDISFECKYNSPLECQSSEGIIILEQFGFHRVNPYASMAVLLFMLFTLLVSAVIVLELKYSKRQWKQIKTNYQQAAKSRFSSLCGCFRSCVEAKKRKKQLEEEERQRLFKLVEEEYHYKKETDEKPQNNEEDDDEDDEDDNKEVDVPTKTVEQEDSRLRGQSFTDAETLDSFNSSNDEDEDPTILPADTEFFVPKQTLQSSITSFISKIQTSVSSGIARSRTNIASANSVNTSNTNNNQNPGDDDVRMRPKNAVRGKRWRTLIGNRRKTFTGVIEESDEIELPRRNRPRSLLLSKNNSNTSRDFRQTFVGNRRGNEDEVNSGENELLSPEENHADLIEVHDTSSPRSELRVIHRPIPPDIIIDIEHNSEVAEVQQQNQSDTIINNNVEATPDAIFSSEADHEKRVDKKQKKRKKKRQKRDRVTKSKDTWSKYLDTKPRRHEVYCALNSIKKRLSGKERMKEKVLLARKESSIKLQRKQSLQILDDKRRSLRDQLSGLQHSIATTEMSPDVRRKATVLRARNKYRNTLTRESHNGITPYISTVPACLREDDSNDFRMSTTSSKRTSKPEENREWLERLNGLSSERNSRTSNILSSIRNSRNDDIEIQNDDDVTRSDRVSTEMLNVLKKLNNLDDSDRLYSNFDSGFVQEEPRRRYFSYPIERNRDSDPLLPQERELVERILHKYDQFYLHHPKRDTPKLSEKFTYSTKVKIKGTSPGHSRKSSNVEKPAMQCRVSANMDHVLEETSEENERLTPLIETERKSGWVERVKQVAFTRRASEDNDKYGGRETDVDAYRDGRTRSRSMTTTNNREVLDPAPFLQNISNGKLSKKDESTKQVKDDNEDQEVDDSDDDEDDDDGDDDAIDEDDYDVDGREDDTSRKSPQQKEGDNSVFGHSESSSEYEEEIVKTQEGFIIPKESINKILGNNMSPLAVGLKLRRESRSKEEEIERQFKRENFLKDRPAKRGIRMPIGSAGKVNLLKSKFESKQTNTENTDSSKIRRSIEKLNQKASSKPPRGFFQKFRAKSSQNSESDSENEVTGVPSPVINRLLEETRAAELNCIRKSNQSKASFSEFKSILTERESNFEDNTDIGERHTCSVTTPVTLETIDIVLPTTSSGYDSDRSNFCPLFKLHHIVSYASTENFMGSCHGEFRGFYTNQ